VPQLSAPQVLEGGAFVLAQRLEDPRTRPRPSLSKKQSDATEIRDHVRLQPLL